MSAPKIRMFKIARPSGWLPLRRQVICHGERAPLNSGTVAGYGENPQGEAFYLIETGQSRIWKSPEQIQAMTP